jgi:hypothetical protein
MVRTYSRSLMRGLALWLTCSSVFAQTAASLCNELEAVAQGEFVHGHSGALLTTATLRPAQEPVAVGRSVVKGAMARRLAGGFDGAANVRWSAAQQRGPVSCGSFNAYQLLVDPVNIRMSEN